MIATAFHILTILHVIPPVSLNSNREYYRLIVALKATVVISNVILQIHLPLSLSLSLSILIFLHENFVFMCCTLRNANTTI